ncbi:hypothetical protein FB45DRAFT_920465 [Roridomyces roridus]|uniref:Nephrocystin 3-like N-terminal domain-containing protein n=1 Tax=Roridomyces roridus TaxID=1738132 RepID=A0AAD7BPM8_9AGAR|nr:hypothetical protein FB45DRAFT_920465 [Roridomyces roridus]
MTSTWQWRRGFDLTAMLTIALRLCGGICGQETTDLSPASANMDVSTANGSTELTGTSQPAASHPLVGKSSVSTPFTIPTYIETIKTGFVLLAKKVEPFVDGTPFKIPLSVLNSFIDLAATVSDNKSTLAALLRQLADTVDVVNDAMYKATSDDAKVRARKLSESLSQEMQDFEALQRRRGIIKVLESDEDIKIMEAAIQRIHGQLQNFQLAMITSIERMARAAHENSVLQSLYRVAANDASHDSGERFPPPQCHPQTRTEILQQLAEWSLMDDRSTQILWLHGPAGAVKSAIAQSFCQDTTAQDRLVASFFFKRGDPSRGESMKLFPTIAHQFACLTPELGSAIVDQMDKHPSVFDKPLSTQLEMLILKPLQHAPQACIPVVIIDGLDECTGEQRQQEIICVIAQSLSESQRPIRFLVASRPEPQISQLFREANLQNNHRQINVSPSFDDIRTYLRDNFGRISRDHETMAGIPAPWPSHQEVELLVEKSSGYFIYAATVIKFIDDPDFRPTDRLETILRMGEPEDESPFAALDQLYIQILEAAPARSRQQLLPILSVLALQLGLSVPHIEQLLGLKTGDARLTLRRVHSVIKVPSDPKSSDPLQTHHASFLDFLNDQSRARAFHVGVGSIHLQRLAADILKAFACPTDDPVLNAIGHLAGQIELEVLTSASPSTELFDYLRAVNPDFILGWRDMGQFKAVLKWLKKFQPSPPADLLSLWEEYHFMALCTHVWDETLYNESDKNGREKLLKIEDVTARMPPELIRLLHAQLLLYDASSQAPDVAELRYLFNYSWEEMRNLLMPIHSFVNQGDTEENLKLFFWSVCHPTRLHQLHPEETLVKLAQCCLRAMITMTRHEIPNWMHATPGRWGLVLRACPPDPLLLHTLCEAECLSALNAVDNLGRNNRNFLNAIEWLKTFPSPSWDLIARMEVLRPRDDLENDPEWSWESWKARTGW